MDDKQQKKMFFGILLVMAMELIDMTVLNNILPDIGKSLHTGVFAAKLSITSYLVSFGVFIPISVWLSNRLGSRNPMIFSLIGFIASSVLCGLAWNIDSLVVFRVAQGFFAALLLPISQTSMIRLSSSMVSVSAKIGLYSVASACAGQLIGAVFSQYMSWRFAFFINVPFGLISLYYVWKYFYVPFPKEKIKLDLFGFLSIGISIGMLFALSDLVVSKEVSLNVKIILGVVPVILCLIYFLNIKRVKTPILNFALFKNRSYSISLVIILINKLCLYWIFIALPIYFYLYIGYSLTTVALIMISLWGGNFFSKNLSVIVTRLIGMKHAIVLSSVGTMVLMILWGLWLESRVNLSLVLILIPLLGVMMCLFQTSANSYILVVVDDKDKADSNVLSKSLVMVATGFSISFLGAMYQISQYYLVATHQLALFIWAFEYSFVLSGIVQFIASLFIYFCHRGTSRCF
ncbi:MFS transporter [Francisellaceae bacterium]|nr:MFS transporter [Francisellaceae bacterium]